MLKRILALTLCLLTVALSLASCYGSIPIDAEDKGHIINAYVAGDMYSFDPGKDITDESAVKFYGLIYEGLFRLDEKGNVKNALAENVKIIENDANKEYKMQIRIKETKWSNGQALTADDFVFAWKRLMEPTYQSTAAALLYDVKNARTVKAGDASIDDLGVVALDTYLLEISFETKIDYENFKKNLASVALVPLREDVVATNQRNWARKHSTLVTNGPFAIKNIDRDENTLRLERNIYYYRDTEEDMLDRYVKPYRINVSFIKEGDKPSGQKAAADDLDAIYAAYQNGDVLYMDDVPLSKRSSLKKDAHVTNANSTYSYLFNTENKILSDARVRKALSISVDRKKIADMLVYADPATGLIANTVFNDTKGKTYREVHGGAISTSADLNGAKNLLAEAGVTSGTLTLKFRANDAETKVAEYVAGEWEKLGFTVKLVPLTATTEKIVNKQTEEEEVFYYDSVQEAYETGDFDILAVDISMYGTDPFAALSVYATKFSGNGINMADRSYEFIPHVTGFSNPEYDAIIEKAFNEKKISKRSDILYTAEKMLMNEAPVMPLVFNKDYYISKDLKDIKTSYLGYRDFNNLQYPGYKYVPEEK